MPDVIPPTNLPINFFDIETISNFCNFVIALACKDYQYILCGGNVQGSTKESLEAFFKSQWFSLLSRNTIDSETLIKFLNDDAKSNNYDFRKINIRYWNTRKCKKDGGLI